MCLVKAQYVVDAPCPPPQEAEPDILPTEAKASILPPSPRRKHPRYKSLVVATEAGGTHPTGMHSF